jgi:hypothetical protein
MVVFYLGVSHPNKFYQHSEIPLLISVNSLLKKRGNHYRERHAPLKIGKWILDSGAFSRISRQFGYKNHMSVKRYAKLINRFADCGRLQAVVAQDYMCESFILKTTELTIEEHQALTIHRFDRLKIELEKLGRNIYVMPVLQGFKAIDYIRHLNDYGDRIKDGDWIGIGSVCRRNGQPIELYKVLAAVKSARPDLNLHGFGIKQTSLSYPAIVDLLYSCDSQAGSLASGGWSCDGRKTTKFQYANSIEHILEYRERSIRASISSDKPLQLDIFNG